MQRFLADGYALIIAVQGERLQVVPRNTWFDSLEDYEIDEAAIDQIYVRTLATSQWRSCCGGRRRRSAGPITAHSSP